MSRYIHLTVSPMVDLDALTFRERYELLSYAEAAGFGYAAGAFSGPGERDDSPVELAHALRYVFTDPAGPAWLIDRDWCDGWDVDIDWEKEEVEE